MSAGRCEVCGKWSPVLHRHHWFATRRFIWADARNEVEVCPYCHHQAHDGDAAGMKRKCLAVVARREGMEQAELIEYLTRKKWGRE